ncbi:retrovirus-related Pol polyprotein from transposon 297 [Trichonephila clavipes]|uniref:RNA-directed DNA polymerase n=1 Tax=Trichonephila clavipes TaxID=2585209 RepID=A0A8X7BEW5_TRICX|nr:retrovirus-related Pol polyprotein from transposon 297 [Trichonephila clavipes]
MAHLYSSECLSGAAPNFQKAIDIILKPVIGRFVSVYMCVDDVIITSPSFNEHLDHLNQVFTLLRDAGLTLNKEKYHFARDKVKYLGLVISKEGIETDNSKVKAITETKPPKIRKEVSKFLGMAGWYQKFIPKYADICEPLYRLKKKRAKFNWSTEAQDSFDKIKRALTEEPVLQLPNFTEQLTYLLMLVGSELVLCLIKTKDLLHSRLEPSLKRNETILLLNAKSVGGSNNNLIIWKKGKRVTVNIDQERVYHPRQSDTISMDRHVETLYEEQRSSNRSSRSQPGKFKGSRKTSSEESNDRKSQITGSQSIAVPSHLGNARQGKPPTDGSKHDMTGQYDKARKTRTTTSGTNRSTERRPVWSKQATTVRPCPYYLQSRVKQPKGVPEDRSRIGIESIPQNNIRRRSLSMEALDGDPVDRSE